MITPKVYSANLPIKDLVLDKLVQMRASLNRSAIIDYADLYESGVKLPKIVVYFLPGGKKYVADGFHRVLAKKSLVHRGVKGHDTISCLVRPGTKRDAILFAAGANRSHGVRRTNEDKAKTVLAFLGDKEWKEWADSEIARHSGVSPSMVHKYRAWLGTRAESRVGANGAQQRTFTTTNGETRVTSTPAPREEILGRQLNRELCPYCGQRLPGNMKGRRKGIVDRHAREEERK